MLHKDLKPQLQAEYWLVFFIFIHLIGWTLLPALVRYNLPLDSIEGSIWGHQLQLGYDKNPFLNGWLTAFATYLGGPSGWMVYLFSQLSVVICFWATWQLAKEMLPPIYALISVMMLELVQYYNFHAIDFNDNTLELSLWALTIYFFHQALCKAKTRDWVLVGIFAGLGMMTKYYTAFLLTSMALFLLIHPANRKQLTTTKPYVGLLAFLLVILPHVIWLFFHDFMTVSYMIFRTNSIPRWSNRFFFPVQFAWQQLEAFLPALIIFVLLFVRKKSAPEEPVKLSPFNRSFLLYVGLGPFLLTMLLSLCFSIKLRAGWGMPLLSLWGIMLVALAAPSITESKLHRFIASIFLVMGISWIIYSVSLIYSKETTSANFPGREIAQTITQIWHNTYHTPLTYVGGSRWVNGNIEFYSDDHPAVFMEWDKHRSPWINLDDMEKKGAVFVWDLTRNENIPDEIREQFPQLSSAVTLEFEWLRNKNNLPPIRLGVAFLPPKETTL